MKPFHELNRTAQFRRLTLLAHRALLDYDLGEVSLSALQHIQNATWRVQCRGGQRYVLRIHAPRRHDAATIRSELLWLEALSGKKADLLSRPPCGHVAMDCGPRHLRKVFPSREFARS